MTPDKLASLRAAAEAATPGPWTADRSGGGPIDEHEGWLRVGIGPTLYPEMRARDAIHIAEADPPTVLALVAEIERLRNIDGQRLASAKRLRRAIKELQGDTAEVVVVDDFPRVAARELDKGGES